MDTLPTLMLAASLVGFYLSARAAAVRPVGRGWASLLPLAGVCGVAAGMGHGDVALGAALSGALAAMGLVAGMVLLQGRPDPHLTTSATRALLMLPVLVAVLLIGLGGSLTPMAAGLLLVLAVAVRFGVEPQSRVVAPYGLTIPRWVPAVQVTLAGGIAVLAGWSAVEAAVTLGARHAHASAGLIAACVLGPAATLPLLGWATARAAEGAVLPALATCVRYAQRVLLLVLPLITAIYLAGQYLRDPSRVPGGLPFPATLYRVETVLLMAFSALVAAMLLGRFAPTRRDGLLILAVYLGYIVLSSAASVGLF